MFMLCAVLALVHARREGRDHVLIWVAAIVAGTANDMIFMALPLVDNFWQAQATVMITARLPLYIPCVYVCFMYFPTVAVRRLRLHPLAQAAAAGLAGCLFYAPYDIVGAKFMWWTWHDTDASIATRLLGAPISSSLWVLTFVASFAFLIDRALRREPGPNISARTFGLGLALVAGLSSLLMTLQITVLQAFDGGTPSYRAFFGGLGIYLAVVIWKGRQSVDPEPPRAGDRLLWTLSLVYFTTLILLMAAFDPATHRSPGVHQLPGECYVEVQDITGATRHEYLCVDDFDEDYDFSCVEEPPIDGQAWYTICGRAHSRFGAWMAGVGGLGLVGIALFSLLLLPARRRLSR
ncbi:hypothetical protein G6O69_12950 [Pseudenhygromyxa sp. WMMC2535]|uniref:DUF7802 domain-containing protein n=1 Tax=Pseudenhygromyxa sp. WMMC2535 TaxID=2712867 RepID=UPI001557266B|nr:hypothetical protein [Pseudenhygromyxa sp. WMMC2535]NVB38741.1 hypothetical protein [Pseudenhygromyxa sp. WMMC2535]